MSNPRRIFILQASTATVGVAISSLAFGQKPVSPELVKDTDANAGALGYKTDGSKTDTTKYPKYAAAQNCASCALYQGTAKDTAGGCPLFAGKQVAAKGWCSAWAKKAA